MLKTQASIADRKREYLETFARRSPSQTSAAEGIFNLIPLETFYLIPRLELGVEAGLGKAGPALGELLRPGLERINARRDCADFVLAGLLRVVYRRPDTTLLAAHELEAIRQATLGFCYWYDQPGVAGMCFHTENHQILFHCCELLAGQLFPGTVFSNSGQPGSWHVEQATRRTLQWMEHRARFGFSEWLSCYFDEDLLALVNLYDFAQDETIRQRAKMLIDMLLFETALHSHRGILGSTHGRTYAEFIKGGRQDPTSAVSWLLFGTGALGHHPTLALTALATSDYACPPLIEAVAHGASAHDTSASHAPPEMVCRERHGLNVEDVAKYGLQTEGLDDAMFFWACQTARHPQIRRWAHQLAEVAHDRWLADFVATVDGPLDACRTLAHSSGATWDGDAVNTSLSEANLYTYRTPEYSLSCAQDFRAGKPGYQQHIWQATLDADAVVFTNHPGAINESSAHSERPNFWAGNRFLPRAVQHKNVVICIHNVPADDPLPFSHAYFPRAAFEEVVQCGNWTFGRQGEGYVALYSQHLAQWMGADASISNELRADSPRNIWICEMGSYSQHGSFDQFVAARFGAALECRELQVCYDSPSQGEMRLGWTGPLTVNEQAIECHGYPRFDNPYCHAELGDTLYHLRCDDTHLTWDFR